MALKLKYLNTFIDVVEPVDFETTSARAQSLPSTPTKRGGEGCSEWYQQEELHVRGLSDKLQTLTMRTLKAAVEAVPLQQRVPMAEEVNLSGTGVSLSETNIGSAGHPELCCRPCVHFLHGQCRDGTDCMFCHEVHPRKEAKLDKSQRKIMQDLSSQQCAALILDFVKSRLAEMAGVAKGLVSCLEEESAQQAFAGSISSFEFRRLRKTLSHMNVYSLLVVFSSRASQYSKEDRVRVERVFRLVQTIRNQLVSRN